jgi:hypothetical protein
LWPLPQKFHPAAPFLRPFFLRLCDDDECKTAKVFVTFISRSVVANDVEFQQPFAQILADWKTDVVESL